MHKSISSILVLFLTTTSFFSAQAAEYTASTPYHFDCVEKDITTGNPLFAKGTYNYDGQLTDVQLGELDQNQPIHVNHFKIAKVSSSPADRDATQEWQAAIPFVLGNTDKLENIRIMVKPETLKSEVWAGQLMRLNALQNGQAITARTFLCR